MPEQGHSPEQPAMGPEVSPMSQPDVEPQIQSAPEAATPSETPAGDFNPVDVPVSSSPVPSTDEEDEELFSEETGYHVTEDQAWRIEIDINDRDIAHWKEERRPEQMSFLATAAKRQRSEVKSSSLTAAERLKFQQAKDNEIDSWLATETVVRIARNQVPRENIMRSRWILSWKEVDQASTADTPKPGPKPKARLMVLAFEDPLVDQIPRDSPTMSKLSRVLIMQYGASAKWELGSAVKRTTPEHWVWSPLKNASENEAPAR